ncbi:MAG TPA: HYR domain-containing protein, partial [Verrucomicrobiota bacterium]|nr:HYR domain-containing protein [Verrucomicrobiota bacterium]
TFPKGVTVNTFRVTDRAGNTNLCSFTVTVNDNEPPGLTCPPDIVIATSPGQPHAPSSGIGVAGATDNCGIATVTNNAPPLLPVGTNIVTWTAVDVSGNQTTCQQKVVVIQTCNGDFGMLPLADQYACPCGVVVFSTVVGALDPVSFQWLFNGQPIPGQTNQSLTIGNLDSTDVGQYTVVASTACKSISSTASLLFLAAPLGNPFSVSNAASISIPAVGNATPYPSVINVQCAPGTLTNLTVTLSGFSHSWPDDVDILLIAPDGRGIKLMSDAGGGGSVNGLTLTFSSSVTNTLPDEDFNGPMVSGTYRPTDFEPNDFVAEATVTNLAQFNGMDPNGEWYLLVRDDTSPDGGFILNGWSLNISWDSSRAQLMNPRRLPDGRFQATLVGQEDVALVVEASTNLTTWLPVSTNVITGGGSTTFTDNQMPPHQRRFYRVVSCQ